MYGNDFSSSGSNYGRGILGKFRKRRFERNRATAEEGYRRYETIKTEYGWDGRKYPFILHGDSCETKHLMLYYAYNSASTFSSDIEEYLEKCERKAERHRDKQQRQKELRAKHSDLYGDLDSRIRKPLGGKIKYTKKGVWVALPFPDEIGCDDMVRYGYNEFDKTCLEEKVVICEQAHQKRLTFIATQGANSEV